MMHYVISACIDYMEFLRSDNFHEDRLTDYKQVIFENALELCYGERVWDEITERLCGKGQDKEIPCDI